MGLLCTLGACATQNKINTRIIQRDKSYYFYLSDYQLQFWKGEKNYFLSIIIKTLLPFHFQNIFNFILYYFLRVGVGPYAQIL